MPMFQVAQTNFINSGPYRDSWTSGYNEFDFFKKTKNTDPLMGAKFKSKTHLLNTFFLFLAPFFARLASKFEKVLIRHKIVLPKSEKVSKTQNFMLISNPSKKIFKNAPKKVISKTSLTNMSKSGKSAYFRHVFANNCLKTFSTDLKSACNSAFF